MNKQTLRTLYKEKRKHLSPSQLDDCSQAICQRLFSNFVFEKQIVSLFLPIEKFKEINTYLIFEKAKSLEVSVAVPKINPEKIDLKHFLLENYTQLEVNTLGIPEPKKGKIIAADRINVVLVPLLAFDKRGYRVGYGKGYYDKFLKKCAPQTKYIGLSQFECLDEEIEDIHPGDMKLHACITPSKIHWF